MRSPIEAMIDAACGIKPGEIERLKAKQEAERITLRCPACGTTKRADRHFTDPLDAAVVESSCGNCEPVDGVRYFDASGDEITQQ